MGVVTRSRGAARRLVLGLAAGLGLALPAAGAAESLEWAVKAAYLAKFGFYVEWPAEAFEGPGGTLNLCVVGDDPFGSLIDDAVAGQKVGGRAISVRRLKNLARGSGCHIAYVGSEPRPPAVVENVRGSPMLVVTDASSATPGVIQFVLKDNRVRFSIDDEAAAQNGINVSSKLLSLAVSVKPRGRR